MSKKGSITTADYLKYDDFKRLVESLDNDGQYLWSTYCMLSFCLGLRAGDVRKIKWGDVLNKKKYTVTEHKTSKTKNIPIGENISERITQMYEKMGFPLLGEYIFCSAKSKGKPISIQYINRIVKKWRNKYGLPIDNISTHTFRKTFGRYVYEKRGRSNEALIELMRIFRHDSLQTTMIYIGLTDDNIYGMFNSMDI